MDVISELKSSFASLRYLRRRELGLLGGADLLDTMSVSIIVPLLPLYANELGAGYLLIGVIFSAEPLAKVVFSTPFGYLSDRFDRKIWIVIGMALSAVTVIGLGFVESALAIVGLRAIDGMGTAMRNPASTAYVADMFPEEERGKAMGAFYTVGSIGLAFGPAVGGGLAVPFGFAGPFVVLGSATLLASLALLVYLPPSSQIRERSMDESAESADDGPAESADDEPAESADEEPTDAGDGEPAETGEGTADDSLLPSLSSLSQLKPIFSVAFVVLAVSGFLAQIGTGIFNPLIAPLLETNVGGDAGYIGLAWSAFGLGMLLFTPIGGSFADRFGRTPMLTFGYGFWAIIAVLLTLVHVRILPVVLLFFGGAATALMGPALKPLLYEIAPEGLEGTAIGSYSSLTTIGFIAGPMLGGYVTDVSSVTYAFWLIAGMYGISAVLVAIGLSRNDAVSKEKSNHASGADS